MKPATAVIRRSQGRSAEPHQGRSDVLRAAFRECHRFGQMHFVVTMPACVVEINVVVVAGPHGSETNLAWALDRELVAAQLPLFDQRQLGELGLLDQQVFFFAELGFDKRSEFIQVANTGNNVAHSGA